MAIKWNPSSGSLPSGSSPKLTPTTISGGAAVNMQPSLVSPNAANVQATDTTPNQVVGDTTLQSAAAATNELVKAAFAYQERVDQLEADQAVLDYKRLTREMFYGREIDGKFHGGYGTTEMKDALDAFGGYRGGVSESAQKVMDGRSESVKAKMMARIQQEKDVAENRGIEHNYSQLAKYEMNVRFQEKNDILKDIELNGPSAWTNGVVETHLNQYKDARERQAAEEFLAENTLFMTYNDVNEKESNNIGNLTPAVTAYEATAKAFGMLREGLSEATENRLQNWLQSKQNTAKSQAKAAYNANVKRNLDQMERKAPNNMALDIVNGNFDLFNTSVEGYRQTTGSSDKALKAVKAGLDLAVMDRGGATVADKRAYTTEVIDNIKANNTSLTPAEMLEVETYALTALPKKLAAAQQARDIDILAQRDLERAKARREGRAPSLVEVPPSNMLPENQTKFLKQLDEVDRERFGTTEAKADAELTNMKAQVTQGIKLTPTQLRKLSTYSTNNLIPEGEFVLVKSANDKLTSNGGRKKPYQQTGGYQAAVKTINGSGYQIAGPPPQKPPTKSSVEVQTQYLKDKQDWDTKTTKWMATAKLELDNAASKAFAAGQEFDNDKWWADHVRKSINSGLIIAPEVLDGRSWWQKGMDAYDPDANVEAVYDVRSTDNIPDVAKSVMYDITGNPELMPYGEDSIMDEEQ